MKAMNRYQLYVFSLLLVGITFSCQDNNVCDMETGYAPIHLQAEIIQENVTRANDNGFADGDQVGVFVVDYNEEAAQALQITGNHADNVRFIYNEKDGTWTGSTQLYWKDQTTPIDLYGYYPFDGSLQVVDDYPFEVQRNQRDVLLDGRMSGYIGYEASDFLWSKVAKVYPTEATITLPYRHLFAGVRVSLVEGEGFEENEWNGITKTVLVENTCPNALIDLQTGTVTKDSRSTPITIIPQTYHQDYRAIVVPQTVEAGVCLISVTVDGTGYKFTRNSQMNYEAGKLHEFTLKVNKNTVSGDYEIELISESVLPWENDPLSHNGTAREYICVHVNEGEYIGDVIEQMNLDPKEIKNLKLTGVLSEKEQFEYIRQQMPYLEAIHMKDLRTKNQRIYNDNYYGNYDGEKYGYAEYEDDFIPGSAFENMAFLSFVVWPDHLKGLGRNSFAGTNLRGSLILPEGLKYVGKDCFWAYDHKPTSLSGELYIPSTVEYIGDNAFADCYFNGELVLPQKMKYLGSEAFRNNINLTGQIHIPDGLTEVNSAWLYTGVTGYAEIPQGVKKINGIGCLISGIHIPEGVEEIVQIHTYDVDGFRKKYGENSMNQFMKHDIHLPSTLTKLSERAFYYANSARINIPDGVEIIPNWAFNSSKLQDTLSIPSSVTQIRMGAFAECHYLTAVVLPEKLQEIQDIAFQNCRSLNYIQCLNPEPPRLSGNAFDGVEKNNFTLVVPEGAVEAYKNAEGWREFTRISTYHKFVCRPMSAKLLNKGNTRTIILDADGDWEVTSKPDWVTLSAESGSMKKELTVTIDDLSSGAGDRSGEIVFTLKGKADDAGNPITTKYAITQYDSDYQENSQIELQKASVGKGINIVFTADGYDAEDIADGSFIEDVKEGMTYFFGIEPYKKYQNYFNVYAHVAMSYDSGVCSNVNIWRNTKFNTTYGGGDNDRLKVDANKVMKFVMDEVEGSCITPQNVSESLVICILNSDVYEGICAMYANGSAVAFVPHSRCDYPNDYRGLIQHEAGGHGFGKLGDEYVYHRNHIDNCTCLCCDHTDELKHSLYWGWYRNLSLTGKYSGVEWKHLIYDERYDDIVDIYEGGHYHGRGVYRSEYNSCMNNNVPYYSTISRQAIVERIMDYAGETFNFEAFVSNDSREMGDKFIGSRTGGKAKEGVAMHNSAPIFIKGSPMDYFQQQENKPSK